MPSTRFLMIGGFLGAGKTTSIARLARHYLASGRKVGIVTNDQAQNLVDTQTLRAAGFHVGEVPGACFCCKFDDLIETIEQLRRAERPDVLISEPVGSCTDLVATVLEPLRQLHGDDYVLGPFAVLLKPEHGAKILADGEKSGFSPEAAYIFLKQLEEADLIAINKIDKLSAEEQADLLAAVRRRFPQTPVHTVSAKTGDGFAAWIEQLERPLPTHRDALQIDYAKYAAGEAELGWLNGTAQLEAAEAWDLDALLLDYVTHLQRWLTAAEAEIAHLKVLGTAAGKTSVVNAVHSGTPCEVSVASEVQVTRADLIVNARVAIDPETLATLVTNELHRVCHARDIRATIHDLQRFRPAAPVPTHGRAGGG